MRTIATFMMLGLVIMLSGCNQSLKEIHSSEPRQAATFDASYRAMVACAKGQAQNEEWNLGTGMVESIESVDVTTARINVSVYSPLHRTFLWEMMLQPTATGGTLVEYRDQWTTKRADFQEQAWTIINNCASQLAAASAQTSIKRIEP